MCGLIRATADFSSCDRWEGLTGRELELEHQEEKAAVWLTLGWSLGCRWESCWAAIWGKSDFRLAANDIHCSFHRHLVHNTVSFRPLPSRFWVPYIPTSRQGQLPQDIPLMILPYPAPVIQPFIRPPVITHKLYSKRTNERERHSSCQPVLKPSTWQWRQTALHLQMPSLHSPLSTLPSVTLPTSNTHAVSFRFTSLVYVFHGNMLLIVTNACCMYKLRANTHQVC